MARKWIKTREACHHTGRSRSWFEKHRHELPHYRVGRTYLYDRDELDQWIASHRVEPQQDEIKELVDYAHAKGVELGGYSLLASRSISNEHDAINPETGKPGGAIFGNSPCLCSEWGIDYFHNITTFISQTGLDLLEHDGSYPGDACA